MLVSAFFFFIIVFTAYFIIPSKIIQFSYEQLCDSSP